MRYAIVQGGIVANIIEWDGDISSWSPPEGATMVASDTATPGSAWDGATFAPPATNTAAFAKARLASIDARSVRPLRAILTAQAAGREPESADLDRLAELQAEADTLRGLLLP